jgi:hypothetical protein
MNKLQFQQFGQFYLLDPQHIHYDKLQMHQLLFIC